MLILDRASHSLNDEDCKEVAATLATTPTRQVYLHANSLRCAGAEYIAAGLVLLSLRGGAHVLTRLCLHENAIGDCGTLVLAEAMRSANLVSLVRLDLSSNAIGNAGAAALATALLLATLRPRLEELSLAANRIGHTGFGALLTAVAASEKDMSEP
jgi:Ran GTPase-activating protein (RanGAP) involved in mRNA processing and transport